MMIRIATGIMAASMVAASFGAQAQSRAPTGPGLDSYAAPDPTDPLSPRSGAAVNAETLAAQIASTPVYTTPDAFGGRLGEVAAGISWQNRARGARKDNADASVGASIGLGDPVNWVGATAGVTIYGLSDNEGSAGNAGAGCVAAAINRAATETIWVAAGVENLACWGDTSTNGVRSAYVTANAIAQLRDDAAAPFSTVFAGVGLGNGIYRRDSDFSDDNGGGLDEISPFGSLAVQVIPGLNVIGEWSGYDLGAAVSGFPLQWLVSPRDLPLQLVVGVSDLTESRPRFTVGLSLGYDLHDLAR